MSIRPGRLYHFNGTATTTPTETIFQITKTHPTRDDEVRRIRSSRVSIANTGDTNNLQVSFDGGRNFKTIGPEIEWWDNVSANGVILVSAAATTTYEMYVIEAP